MLSSLVDLDRGMSSRRAFGQKSIDHRRDPGTRATTENYSCQGRWLYTKVLIGLPVYNYSALLLIFPRRILHEKHCTDGTVHIDSPVNNWKVVVVRYGHSVKQDSRVTDPFEL